MKNEKKVTYLTQRVAELEKENLVLKQENQALSTELDENKTAILLRQKALDEKEAQIDETKKVYERTITELKKMKAEYEKAIKVAKEAKKKYEAEIAALIKRLRKQK